MKISFGLVSSIGLLVLPPAAVAQFSPGFNAGVKFEGMLQSALQRQVRLTPSITAAFVPGGLRRTRTLVDLSTQYDRARSETRPLTILRRHTVLVEEMVNLNPTGTRAGFARLELYHNNALGMKLQQGYGAGFSMQISSRSSTQVPAVVPGCSCPDSPVSVSTHSLVLTAELRYLNQQFYRQRRQIFAAAVLGERLQQKLGLLTLTESLFFTLPIAERHSWQFRAMTNVSIPLRKGFSFSVTGLDDYVRNAPPGFRRNFYSINIGVGYNLSS